MNDWDSLRPIDQGDATCSEICAAKEKCIGHDPGCEGGCSGDVVDCSGNELDALHECVQALNDACSVPSAAQAAWSSCLLQVSCYSD